MFFRTPPPIPDAAWRAAERGSDLIAALDAPTRRRLRELAARFLHVKSLEPVRGLTLDDGERAVIAALACLPVLELGLDAYDGWHSLVVYPAGFVARGQEVDDDGVVHEYHEPRSGEAWFAGPVILSLDEVLACRALDGRNVVIHEMAHKLDMLDGDANGRPPLHPGMDPGRWFEAFDAAYAHLNDCLDAGDETLIDPYAAETPGEFFAVASECFFELPDVLRAAYPAVHAQLAAWYRFPAGPGAT